jgi:hypothetical protein
MYKLVVTLNDSRKYEVIRQAFHRRTVMKLKGCETNISDLLAIHTRIDVFSIVNANTKRRRGSSTIISCMFPVIFPMSCVGRKEM